MFGLARVCFRTRNTLTTRLKSFNLKQPKIIINVKLNNVFFPFEYDSVTHVALIQSRQFHSFCDGSFSRVRPFSSSSTASVSDKPPPNNNKNQNNSRNTESNSNLKTENTQVQNEKPAESNNNNNNTNSDESDGFISDGTAERLAEGARNSQRMWDMMVINYLINLNFQMILFTVFCNYCCVL